MYCSAEDCKIFKGRLLVCRECPLFEEKEAESGSEEVSSHLEIAE